MENCFEKILEDIVQIDFYDATDSAIVTSVPFAVAGVTSMTVQQTVDADTVDIGKDAGSPQLSIVAFDEADADVMMTGPTYKYSSKRETAGDIYQHVLEIPIEIGHDYASQSVYSLAGKEIFAVITSYGGSKYCIHHLPETARLTYSGKHSGERSGTVTFEAASLSGPVRIVETDNT